jgi:hypothetical protein
MSYYGCGRHRTVVTAAGLLIRQTRQRRGSGQAALKQSPPGYLWLDTIPHSYSSTLFRLHSCVRCGITSYCARFNEMTTGVVQDDFKSVDACKLPSCGRSQLCSK